MEQALEAGILQRKQEHVMVLSALKDLLSDKFKSSATEGKRWDVINNGIKRMSDVSQQILHNQVCGKLLRLKRKAFFTTLQTTTMASAELRN